MTEKNLKYIELIYKKELLYKNLTIIYNECSNSMHQLQNKSLQIIHSLHS